MSTYLDDDLVPGEPPPPDPDAILPHREGEIRGWLTESVSGLFRLLTWLSPLPVGRRRLFWFFPRPAGRAVAELYVVAWLIGLGVCVGLAPSDAGPYVAGVALFRYGDVVATRLAVLFDVVGPRLADPRRTLALVGLHAVELVLVVATVYRWQLDQRLGSALSSGFDALTLQGSAGAPGNWLDAARVLGGAGMLVLALAAVVAAVRLARERP